MQKVEKLLGAIPQTPLGDYAPLPSTPVAQLHQGWFCVPHCGYLPNSCAALPKANQSAHLSPNFPTWAVATGQVSSFLFSPGALTLSVQSGLSASTYLFGGSQADSEDWGMPPCGNLGPPPPPPF